MKKKTRFLAGFLAIMMLLSMLVPILPISVTAAEAEGVTPEIGGRYMIVAKHSGKAMTVSGYSADNDASIVQMEAKGYASQLWTVADGGVDSGVQYYKLVNYYSGKSMNVPYASTDSGVQVIQWNNGDSNNEKWSLTENGGYYRITPKLVADFGLSVVDGAAYNKASVIQETYTGADNMLWSFVPVETVLENPELEEPDPVKAIDQWLAKFYYVDNNGYGQLSNEPWYGFWTDAEMLEVMLDAYERTGDEKYKTVCRQYFNGFINRNGSNWSNNMYNDDVMWMVIASARAYLLTGETDYLIAAIENFNMCYNRSWDTTHLDGGLWWTTDNDTKNACVNGPGAIAACLIGEATGNEAYYDKAQAIIDWEAEHFLQDDGAIWDSIPVSGNINTWASTYNQGTFIGACAMLYQHTDDSTYFDWAKSAADYASRMGDGDEGLLNREQNDANLIGFKGILGRWIGYFARECNVTDYDAWMYRNAKAAWNNRNSDDLMWTQFGKQTIEGIESSDQTLDQNTTTTIAEFAAWGSSAAVSWLLNYTGEVEVEQADCYVPELAVREMEYGTVAGAQVNSASGMSNGKYVGNVGGDANGTVTFYIESKTEGTATLRVYYATWSARQLGVTVNETDFHTYNCSATGDWTIVGDPIEITINLKKGTNTIVFGGVNGGDAPNLDKFEVVLPAWPETPAQKLSFRSASLTLQTNLQVNYRVNKSLVSEVGYGDPYVVFVMNGVETIVREYTVEADAYVFRFTNIGPKMMNDTIYATLHADYNGEDLASTTLEYSVATYCYNKLNQYTPEKNPDKVAFLTMLVDLLNYGAAAQEYLDYKTDALVNANMTDEQKTWGTSDVEKPETVTNVKYEAIENPTVGWRSARLSLGDTVRLGFKISTADIDGLSVKIRSGEDEWTISSDKFTVTDDGYYDVMFGGLNARQMRDAIYVTVYKDGVAVSNTLSYSIGSYANSKWSSANAELVTLVKEMMKYGDSAKAYVEG